MCNRRYFFLRLHNVIFLDDNNLAGPPFDSLRALTIDAGHVTHLTAIEILLSLFKLLDMLSFGLCNGKFRREHSIGMCIGVRIEKIRARRAR
jgi:hypothetical protein